MFRMPRLTDVMLAAETRTPPHTDSQVSPDRQTDRSPDAMLLYVIYRQLVTIASNQLQVE